MEKLSEWRHLHDGVIESILVTWPGPVTTITIRTSEYPHPLRIVASGTTLLSCPQKYPWGRAKYLHVNEVHRSNTSEGTRLEIETQGGDVILVEASDIIIGVDKDAPQD